uniref:Putative secreted protein n=1 Tax=Ixodes ricinus TaxID=34613 RepID=A0A6B0UHD9_IXORI
MRTGVQLLLHCTSLLSLRQNTSTNSNTLLCNKTFSTYCAQNIGLHCSAFLTWLWKVYTELQAECLCRCPAWFMGNAENNKDCNYQGVCIHKL